MEQKDQTHCASSQEISNGEHIQAAECTHRTIEQDQLSAKKEQEEIQTFKVSHNLRIHVENLNLFYQTSNELIKKMDQIYVQFKKAVKFRFEILYYPYQNQPNSMINLTDLNYQYLYQLMDKVEEQCFKELENGVLFVKNFEILKLISQSKLENCIVKPQIDFHSYFLKQILDNYDAVVNENYLINYNSANTDQEQIIQDSKSHENQQLFQEQTYLKVNSVHIINALKRILKAVKIQIDDYQAGNFQFSSVKLSQDGLGGQNVEEIIQILIQELEQKSEYWLNKWNNKFKDKNRPKINENEIPLIWNGLSSNLQKDLQFQIKNYHNGQNIRQENSSIIDLFPEFFCDKKYEINTSSITNHQKLRQNNLNILLLCLYQSGNTIDGISISSKILQRHINLILKQQSANFNEENKAIKEGNNENLEQINEANKNHSSLIFNNEKIKEIQSFQQVLNKFFDWKKRRCHGCLEYMVETSRAIVCVNVIKLDNPCRKLYCFNCTINYCQSKLKSKESHENGHLQSQASENQDKQKKSLMKQLRKNQRQKAFQNVLFTCPCCQDECQDNFKDNIEISFCKLKNIVERKPTLMLHKHILIQLHPKILNIVGSFTRLIQTKYFILAQVVGYDSPKKLFKINLCYNENNPISKPDKQIDYSTKEEFSFQSSLSPININYMFLSTILYHNDNFSIVKNEASEHQMSQKKVLYSRLYKMLNSAINRNEKSDNLSFISSCQIDQDRKFVIIDIKNEIQESITNLKKQEGKEFLVLERYSEHLAQKGGLDFSQQLGQYQEQSGFNERKNFVESIRHPQNISNDIFQSIQNNFQANNQQLEILHSEEILENGQIQFQEQIVQNHQLTQEIEVPLQGQSQNQNDQLMIQEEKENITIDKINSQNTLEKQSCKIFEKNGSSKKKEKHELLQNGILQLNIPNEENGSVTVEKSQKIGNELVETNQNSKRYIVPVVSQKKLENIQKQLEKEFSKIEKLKAKQAIQENQVLTNLPQNKTLNANSRERQVILKTEEKIDRLLKQESQLQLCQIEKQNRDGNKQNSLNINAEDIKQTQKQDIYQPKEVQIHLKKFIQIEDPEIQQQDQNSVLKSQLIVQNSRIKDGKLYIKRFKYNKRLRMHIKFIKEYASQKPEDFQGIIIYKLNKELNLWYRCKIINNKITQEEIGQSKIEFQIKHMSKEEESDQINISQDEFIIDQAQDPLIKDEPMINSIANLKRNKKINDLSSPEFNDRFRVHRILLKEWQRNEMKMSLNEAISYEDPKFMQQQQQIKQEETQENNQDRIDRKRKKALIVIQTRFPFEQRSNPQILHQNQRQWLGKMKSTPRKKRINQKQNIENTPMFKNNVDEQIYYSDINSEDAYDQQSLNIDNVVSIYQLKIHYCKEIVQHYQYQQINLNMKLYQFRQMQNKVDVDSQNFINPVDTFLVNQKQINLMNYPNVSNPVTVASQPHSVYGDSSSIVNNEKNTVLTISAQDNSQKFDKQKKHFSKGAIEERIRQSMGKRKHFQQLLKLFQQKKLSGLNFEESVHQLNQLNQKISMQQQLDYQQLQNLPYQNIILEQQRIQQLKMLTQQNDNDQKQQYNMFGNQSNSIYNKQMVVQIPNYDQQNQLKKILLNINGQGQYNEQQANNQLQEQKQDINQQSMLNQQNSLMKNNYYNDQNQQHIDINQQNVQQMLYNQNLQSNNYNQYQQQQLNEAIHFQSQNEVTNVPLQQQDSGLQLQQPPSQSNLEIQYANSQNQFDQSFINNHLKTLDNIQQNQQFSQQLQSRPVQQAATLPSTWHYEFYEKKGFRKCGCETCKNVPYPALIAAHANENDSKLVEDHKKYFQNVEVRHQMLLLQQQDLRAQQMANSGLICANTSNIRFTQDVNSINQQIDYDQPDQAAAIQNYDYQTKPDEQNHLQCVETQTWAWDIMQRNQAPNLDQLQAQAQETDQQNFQPNQQEQQNTTQELQGNSDAVNQLNEMNPEDRKVQLQKIEEEMNIQKEQFNIGRQIYEKGFAQLKEQEEQLNLNFQIYNGLIQNQNNEELDEEAQQHQNLIKNEMEQQITNSQQEIYIHQLQLNYQYLKLFEVDQAMTLLQNKIDILNQKHVQPDLQCNENQNFQMQLSSQNYQQQNQYQSNQEQFVGQQIQENYQYNDADQQQDFNKQENLYEPQEVIEIDQKLQ